MQLRWFLDSSNPGRHSQATPPLGVSLQMWAQPWSLFMQLMPSVKQERYKSISTLSSSVCCCAGNKVASTHTQTKPLTLGRLCRAGTRSFISQRGKAASPALQSQWSQGFSFCHLFSACSLAARSKSNIHRFLQHLQSHPMLSLCTSRCS